MPRAVIRIAITGSTEFRRFVAELNAIALQLPPAQCALIVDALARLSRPSRGIKRRAETLAARKRSAL